MEQNKSKWKQYNQKNYVSFRLKELTKAELEEAVTKLQFRNRSQLINHAIQQFIKNGTSNTKNPTSSTSNSGSNTTDNTTTELKELLKFLYDIMLTRMQPEKPLSEEEFQKLKKIEEVITNEPF